MKTLSYSDAIHASHKRFLHNHPHSIITGLGCTDPKSIFGTTKGLVNTFGPHRVFDLPASENATTGLLFGASLLGTPSICIHQRIDFFVLAFDQLINHLAKWEYMFCYSPKAPTIIRLILGRGWGQGPTHSQSFHSFLAQTPNIQVFMPSSPQDVYHAYDIASVTNKVSLILEHRWLYNTIGYYDESLESIPLAPRRLSQGADITIVASSYYSFLVHSLIPYLTSHDISIDMFDLFCLRPLDLSGIKNSLKQTKRLLILDSGHPQSSIADHIISEISSDTSIELALPPISLLHPDYPEPTSHRLISDYHIYPNDIIKAINNLLSIQVPFRNPPKAFDIPEPGFTGPF